MFATAIAYLESKTPTWIKVCIALVICGWMTPLKVREWWIDSIDTRVHAVVGPMNKDRDNEISRIHNDIENLNEKTTEINIFVKEMAIQSLGTKRYQEVSLTMDKTK